MEGGGKIRHDPRVPQEMAHNRFEPRLILDEVGCAPDDARFGAEMQVSLVNDGPVTLLLDTEKGL